MAAGWPGGTTQLLQMLATARLADRKVVCALSMETPADLERVRELVEAGALRPVLHRGFPLEAAADPHRYLEAGHRRGGVVLTVAAAGDRSGAAGPAAELLAAGHGVRVP